jgi:hypothetical protein
MAKELVATGEARFPEPFVEWQGPRVRALRLYEDFVVPQGLTDFQRCEVWAEWEWLSAAELEARGVAENWSRSWMDRVMGTKEGEGFAGQAMFPEFELGVDARSVQQWDAERYAGKYQVCRVYFRSTNTDGIPGRYFVTVHHGVRDEAAHARRLLDYPHGLWPGHLICRETVTKRVLDSRGIPEVMGAHQGILKLLTDVAVDNGTICGVPPVLDQRRRGQGKLLVAPLTRWQAGPNESVGFVRPPEFPAAAVQMRAALWRDVCEFSGREHPEVSPTVVVTTRLWKVIWALEQVKAVLEQVQALTQAFMPDEMLMRVVNGQGEPWVKSQEEIQGRFDLMLAFDPQDLDMEKLQLKGRIYRDIVLATDREQTVQTAPLTQALVGALFPGQANTSVLSVAEARQETAKREEQKLLQIRAGLEPNRNTDGGEDYQTALAWWQSLPEANPQIFDSLAPDQREILAAYIEHLQAMVVQFGENRQIGREGARRADLGAGREEGEGEG